jgi:hypothetical protein
MNILIFMMKLFLVLTFLMATSLASAKGKVILRAPASMDKQTVVCTVGDGKENSEAKTISKPLKISDSESSIDEVIGDFRILAQWTQGANALSVGMIEEKSLISSSTLLFEKNKVGTLFVAKNGQTVDLSCYFN